MASISEHDVTYADNKHIHYYAAGPVNGPLIIFLHGWPATGITWKFQIDTFAGLGFRVIAPDMPGYGQSTARRVVEDYSQEALVEGMMALLADTGRDAAVWVGHDWGAGVTSSVAAQHPNAVKALVNMCVPYHTIELGWDGFLPLVNRDLYAADEYPYGQWDYMRNWEVNFDKAVEWFEQDPAGVCSVALQKSSAPPTRFSNFATVQKVGWFGGLPKPPSVDQLGPPLLPEREFNIFVKDMQRTGFWSGSAYYSNHKRNAAYNSKAPDGGKLKQPVLFIQAEWDTVCDTKTSALASPMRSVCSNLTEVSIETGHWVPIERPEEVNAALVKFILEKLPSEWPGYTASG